MIVKKSDTSWVCGKDAGTPTALMRTEESHRAWAMAGALLGGVGGSSVLPYQNSALYELGGGTLPGSLLILFNREKAVGKYYASPQQFACTPRPAPAPACACLVELSSALALPQLKGASTTGRTTPTRCS